MQIERRKTDLTFRILCALRSRTRLAIKSQKTIKTSTTHILIGCSIEFFKEYIESKFLPTMTWENYGKYWHIDHIVPCYYFDLLKEEEQKRCFHYTNLQPLFARTQIINGVEYIGNLNKRNKIINGKEKSE